MTVSYCCDVMRRVQDCGLNPLKPQAQITLPSPSNRSFTIVMNTIFIFAKLASPHSLGFIFEVTSSEKSLMTS